MGGAAMRPSIAHTTGGDIVTAQPGAPDEPFRLDEATIEELHTAIHAGRTTCVAVVQRYIERVRAYNGVASLLVTEDGAPIPEATGAVRATVPLRFPRKPSSAPPSCPISTSTRDRPSNTAAWRRRPPIRTCRSSSG
jgi:hypothetical protein